MITLLRKSLQHNRTAHTFTEKKKLSNEIILCPNPLITFLCNPKTMSVFLLQVSFVTGICLDLDEVWLELEEQHVLQEPLVKLMRPFVLKLAYPLDSEVDGSERRTAARMSRRRVQHSSSFSPFWHSLLPVIPC